MASRTFLFYLWLRFAGPMPLQGCSIDLVSDRISLGFRTIYTTHGLARCLLTNCIPCSSQHTISLDRIICLKGDLFLYVLSYIQYEMTTILSDIYVQYVRWIRYRTTCADFISLEVIVASCREWSGWEHDSGEQGREIGEQHRNNDRRQGLRVDETRHYLTQVALCTHQFHHH